MASASSLSAATLAMVIFIVPNGLQNLAQG